MSERKPGDGAATTRHKSREMAFQYLFAVLPDLPVKQSFADFCASFGFPVDPFACDLVNTTLQHCAEIDTKLDELSAHWKLNRMGQVDLTILRLASAEILYRQDVPRPVAIDEAIELAKLYGSEDSPAFVNGLLDKLGKS